jgi:cytochrome c oxidase subunit 2
MILVFMVRYRRRPGRRPRPERARPLWLEAAWTVIPFGITMIMFFWGASLYATIRRPPDDALVVDVVGKQWMWKLQHMEGRREINELHVPIGRPVRLNMTSEDVIHSFYVPAFRVKQDAGARALLVALVRGDEGGRVPSLLRGVLRHAALGA